MNYKIGDDDFDLVKEEKMRSSTGLVNGNDDLVSQFDASTCSGDNVYDFFENEDAIITEDSIVWVNTNKKNWDGMVIKILYSDLPHDSNY